MKDAIYDYWIPTIRYYPPHHINNLLCKTNFLNTFVRKIQKTRSYALVIASFTTTFISLVHMLISFFISRANTIFFAMLLPLTKPDWFREIIFGRTNVNLSCNILEMILIHKSAETYGSKVWKMPHRLFSGSNTRFVCVINLGSSCRRKNFSLHLRYLPLKIPNNFEKIDL